MIVILISSCSVENSEPANTAFIAIHLEPGETATSTEYQEIYWPTLVKLVQSADDYNIKLTLLFNPQWATYILQDDEKLQMLRSWEANGHEIGAHHHGPGHKNWNGYTNQGQFKSDPEYIGDMTDYIELLSQLPASGKIYTGCIAAIEDKPFDWPKGVIYSVDGVTIDDLLSTPTNIEYNNQEAMHLTHSAYEIGGDFDVTLDEIESSYKESNSDQILGVVFHEKDYKKNPDKIKELFQFMNDNEIEVKTVEEILSTR